jgi:4-amino-4-deoxy-L-arabinose transferase-like glycosyltransferase
MGCLAASGVWLDRHALGCIAMLLLLGSILRLLLALHSPQPYGYVYDFYCEPIEYMAKSHHYPASDAFWQAYHPPLFYLLGLDAYRLGQLFGSPLQGITSLAMLCGLITIWYSLKILWLYRQRGRYLVLGTALILAFPCLFISSWGAEADILLAALMSGFIYHTLAYHNRRYQPRWKPLVMIGTLAGLAAATKYSGLLALLIFGLLMGIRFIFGPQRRLALRDGLVVFLLTLSLSFWKYYDNEVKYHQIFFANGSAQQGFAMGQKHFYWDRYELTSLRLKELFSLLSPQSPRQKLTHFPVYYSVWTTLHAQAWGDMSFFSDPSRHGGNEPLYDFRGIPIWLAEAVLLLGLLADALAIIGLLSTLRRYEFWPLALISSTTLGVYLFWALAQAEWSLKTKYILFLLPVYVVYILAGLRSVKAILPRWGLYGTSIALGLFMVLTHAYLYLFALGR